MKSVWWTALAVCLVAFFVGGCTEDDEENMWEGQTSGSYTESATCGAACTVGGAHYDGGTCTREITIWYETHGTERNRSACDVHEGSCGHLYN